MERQNQMWEYIKSYFYLNKEKEPTDETVNQIKSGVEFRGANLWILIFAIFTASLGLNVNSTAVIIGAMLISPLMGPIIGMGLSVGINDFELMKRSAKSYLVATVISVITATVYFSLTPLNEAQSELLARTSPTIYDVFIALFGGLAGIVALSTKGKGNVLPGVAIATALMPPLCTAGFGIATGHWLYFLGAFYLFFINTVFISAATFIGVRMMKFPKKRFIDTAREKRVRQYIIMIVVLTMCPSIYMTFLIVKNTIFNANVNSFVKTELKWSGTQIIAHETSEDKKTLRIVAVGKEVDKSSIASAEKGLAKYHLEGVKLQLIQGSSAETYKLKNIAETDNSKQAILQQQSQKINNMTRRVNYYADIEHMPQTLRKELELLFPDVRSLSLSRAVNVSIDTLRNDTFTLAVVNVTKNLAKGQNDKLRLWLKARTHTDSLRLIVQRQQ